MILHLLICVILAPLGAIAALVAGHSIPMAILTYIASGVLSFLGSAGSVVLLRWLHPACLAQPADVIVEVTR